MAGVVSGFTLVTYSPQSTAECGQSDTLQDEKLMAVTSQVQQQLGPPGCNPPRNRSCQEILRCNPSASSGYYQIQAANGSLVYCDMEGTNCGGEGSWMRVVHLNMTDPCSQCPAGFRVETINNKRFCIRDTNAAGCQPITAESFGLTYSRVCGYVRGYAFHSLDGFEKHSSARSYVLSGNYVDGVSITYGNISHIWTYAAGLFEGGNSHNDCPCNTNGVTDTVPEFVGNDYYCESSTTSEHYQSIWYTTDPLWDGMQCGGNEVPCCNHTGLPWFNKNILIPTTATITTRVCLDEATSNEDVGIERFELYVK